MRIGKLASEAGVGVETVRFYERRGLIVRPPKSSNSAYRDYDAEIATRIRFIRQAQHLGFSLKEIDELLYLKDTPASNCADVRDHARSKREEVVHKISQLQQMRDALDALIDTCPGQGALSTCSIIEALEVPQAKAKCCKDERNSNNARQT